jgi:hypothetical protein
LWVAAFVAGGALAFSTSGIGKAPDQKPALHSCLQHHYWIVSILVICALINPQTDHGLQPLAVKGKFEFSRISSFEEMEFLFTGRCRTREKGCAGHVGSIA